MKLFSWNKSKFVDCPLCGITVGKDSLNCRKCGMRFETRLDSGYVGEAIDHYKKGIREQKSGRHKKAITHYTAAIELLPTYTLAYNNRGVAYQESGEIENALLDYEHAIKLQRKLAVAYYNKGVAYKVLGKLQHALINFDVSIRFNSNTSTCGRIYFL
mgnify:CR=1 FL=1